MVNLSSIDRVSGIAEVVISILQSNLSQIEHLTCYLLSQKLDV